MTLTAPARALAAFALAITVLLGSWVRGGVALVSLLQAYDHRAAAIVGSLVPLAAGGLAYVLAQKALRDASTSPDRAVRWETHLAGSARLLAAAGILLTVLTLLAGVARESGPLTF